VRHGTKLAGGLVALGLTAGRRGVAPGHSPPSSPSLAERRHRGQPLAGEADDQATVVDVVGLGDVAGVAGVHDRRRSAGAPHDSTAFPNELGNAAVLREVLAHADNQFCSDRNSQLLERFEGGPGATPFHLGNRFGRLSI